MWGQPRRDPGLQHPPETGDSEASGWEAVDGNTQAEISAGPPAHRMRTVGAAGRPESPGRGCSPQDPSGPWRTGGEVGRPGRRLPTRVGSRGDVFEGRGSWTCHSNLQSRPRMPAVMTGCLSPTHGRCLQPGGSEAWGPLLQLPPHAKGLLSSQCTPSTAPFCSSGSWTQRPLQAPALSLFQAFPGHRHQPGVQPQGRPAATPAVRGETQAQLTSREDNQRL